MMHYDMDIWAREIIFQLHPRWKTRRILYGKWETRVLERRVLERQFMATRVVAARGLVVKHDSEPLACRGTRCAPCVSSGR